MSPHRLYFPKNNNKRKRECVIQISPSTSFKITTLGFQIWSYFLGFSELKKKIRKKNIGKKGKMA